MNKVINLTEKELANELYKIETIKGMPMFASILQVTLPKVTKKNRVTGEPNPYNEIKKVSKVAIILNSEYEKAVINQLAREDKEATEYKQGVNTNPLTFGENNTIIGQNDKGEIFLQYRPNDNVKPQNTYFADDKTVSKESIENYLPLPPKPAENQGTERQIHWRKVNLKNIVEITINGTTYKVIK